MSFEVRGIDVSKWQAATPSLAGQSFLFARASIGLVPDLRYPMHIANARAAGLLVGAYHFGDDRIPWASQARAFLAAAGEVDFYVLDHEGDHAMRAADARAFIAAVRAATGRCGLYHSLDGFPDLGQDFNWVALWAGAEPRIPWTFWQYSGTPLDQDVFNGSLAELQTLAHRQEADLVKLVPGLGWRTAIVPKGAGIPILDAPGGTTISTTKDGDRFPEVGDTGSYHVVRLAGDVAGYIAHGSTAPTVPWPAAPDCQAAVDAALDHVAPAVAAVTKAIDEARVR